MTSPSSLSYFSFVIWGQKGQEMDRGRNQSGDLDLQQTLTSQARNRLLTLAWASLMILNCSRWGR